MCVSAWGAEPYFNLSTYKSFAPDERPRIHLYARNVDELEFRVYHVNDPDTFVANLPQMHSFGPPRKYYSPVEQIDEKTWLERFHDWKLELWDEVKDFVRTQLSHKTRQALTERQSRMARRSRIVGVAQFAQIPLLNDKQLVARWRQEMPPTFVSDNQVLPIDRLPGGMYLVEATDGHEKAYTILLVSVTALVTRTVAGDELAYAVDRKTGVPVAGAKVSLGLSGYPVARGVTDEGGVAEFHAPDPKTKAAVAGPAADECCGQDQGFDNDRMWVIARSGNDVALVAPFGGSFTSVQGAIHESYVYTDRPVYRPGHTVHWKGVLRQYAGNALVLPKVTAVHVRVTDAAGKTVSETDVKVSANGTLNGDVTLAKDAALGEYSIQLSGKGGDDDVATDFASFTVEEYRKPEYEVKVTAEKQHLLEGEANTITIDSRYFFGEPVVGAKVKYTVQQSVHEWWDEEDDDDNGFARGDEGDGGDEGYGGSYGDEENAGTGTLDANGKLVVKIPTRFVENAHDDKDYTVSAGVTDQAGREISGKYKFLATYGTFRIGVEPLSYFAKKGDAIPLKVTAVDYDGHPVATHVHIKMEQTMWRNGKTTVTPAGEVDGQTDASGAGTVSVTPGLSGGIEVMAAADTPEHRTVEARTWVYVAGPGSTAEYGEEDTVRQEKIIADKKSYAPGDVAHLSVVGDVTGFHALVTAKGYTVEFRKTLTTDGDALMFDLPITSDSQPNLTVEAVFVKDGVMYEARKSLKVPPAQQALQVEVTPAAATFQPQQTAAYDVLTKDAAGKPVSAELSFGVVDEAIYSLYPDHSGDILKALYPERDVYADVETSLTYYFSGEAGNKSPMLAERKARYRPMLAQVKSANDVKQPHIRKDFPDTAFWAPDIHTDANGHARVTLTFPDSLTTWRATVRAITADSKAGSVINRVIVRKNIIVRMGQPRFLRKGDVVGIPVIVHNYLATPKQVTLSLDATGLNVVSGSTQQVMVPSKGEASAVWKLRAGVVGDAKLLAKAISNEESDALEMTVPVKPSGVAKTMASSGAIVGAGDRTVAINFPAGTDASAHGLEVTVSPSIAGSMYGALEYLSTFPYGCTEQTMSSFLPNILIADATARLHLTKTVEKTVLDARIQAGFDRLSDYQHADGGWGWWKEDASNVFMSAFVVSGYGQARRLGYGQKEMQSLRQGVEFLQTTLRAHPRMLPELRAYVVYALAESGMGDAGLESSEIDTLYGRRKDLSPQGLAFTGLAMQLTKHGDAGEIAALLSAKATKDGDRVHWVSMREPLLDIDADGSAEATAYALKFLVHQAPDSPLLMGSALWLMANRSEGFYWSSTEQTTATLLGLTDYLEASHELAGEGDVEVLVNGTSLGKKHFTQADALGGATLAVSVDAGHLQALGNEVKVISKGSGRAYYAVSAKFFSTDKKAYQQGTMSLNIARDYFRLVPDKDKQGNIIYRLKALDGPVAQGDVLAVHLGVTGSPAKYLLIEDPIPAGVEFIQDEGTFNIVDRPNGWGYWYTRREFHDDRAAIFASYFEKRQDMFYLLKVINAGSYAISPASVEPMYQPGVQATTDELHLDVRDVAPGGN